MYIVGALQVHTGCDSNCSPTLPWKRVSRFDPGAHVVHTLFQVQGYFALCLFDKPPDLGQLRAVTRYDV